MHRGRLSRPTWVALLPPHMQLLQHDLLLFLVKHYRILGMYKKLGLLFVTLHIQKLSKYLVDYLTCNVFAIARRWKMSIIQSYVWRMCKITEIKQHLGHIIFFIPITQKISLSSANGETISLKLYYASKMNYCFLDKLRLFHLIPLLSVFKFRFPDTLQLSLK